MRAISYAQAIREAHAELLACDERVFVIGQGVRSPWYVGTSMQDLDREFGTDRIIDSPISENGVTGAALGAALAGMHPIALHPRMDFLLLAIDQVVNQAANWCYMSGGRVHAPLTVRAIINRGGEQAAQHSQSVHAWFMHVPGLKVVLPSIPYDAKGLLVSAVEDGNPVLYIDDRWLYNDLGEVPEGLYRVPIGKAIVRRPGKDVSVIACSFLAREAVEAAAEVQQRGIEVEVVDLRTLNPLDRSAILDTAARTGRVIVADGGWMSAGMSAEVAAVLATDGHGTLREPLMRVTLPHVPAPMSKALEGAYYPTRKNIVRAVERILGLDEDRKEN